MKPFRKILTICAPLIVLLLGVGLIMQLRPRGISQPLAFAKADHEGLLPTLSESIVQKDSVAREKPNPPNLPIQEMMNPGMVDQPLQELAEIENILSELSQKNRAWLSTPGWLHIVTEGFSLPATHGEYQGIDMQDMFSSEGVGEKWTHIIDSQGNIAEGLFVSRTTDGHELQRSVTRSDGTSGNLTLLRKGVRDLSITSKEEKNSRPIQTRPTTADEALGDLQRWRDTATISGWQEEINGRQAFVYYLEQGNGEPMQVKELQELVVGSSEKIIFDLETGHPVSIEYQLLTEKGEWVLLSRTEYRVVEIVPELPDSVAEEYQQSVDELNSYLESGQ